MFSDIVTYFAIRVHPAYNRIRPNSGMDFLNYFCNFLYDFSKSLASVSLSKYSKSRRQHIYYIRKRTYE